MKRNGCAKILKLLHQCTYCLTERWQQNSDLSRSESVLVKQVLSHFAVWVRRDEATQAASVVTQHLNGVVTVSKEVAL